MAPSKASKASASKAPAKAPAKATDAKKSSAAVVSKTRGKQGKASGGAPKHASTRRPRPDSTTSSSSADASAVGGRSSGGSQSSLSDDPVRRLEARLLDMEAKLTQMETTARSDLGTTTTMDYATQKYFETKLKESREREDKLERRVAELQRILEQEDDASARVPRSKQPQRKGPGKASARTRTQTRVRSSSSSSF